MRQSTTETKRETETEAVYNRDKERDRGSLQHRERQTDRLTERQTEAVYKRDKERVSKRVSKLVFHTLRQSATVTKTETEAVQKEFYISRRQSSFRVLSK